MSRSLRLVCILLLAAIAVCMAEESVAARTYYVRKRGNDRNNGTSARSAFKTVSRALRQRLTHGDKVYIGAGTYTAGGAIRALSGGSPGGGHKSRSGRVSSFLTRPLRIVADTTGRFTGDRGPVVIAAANRWAFTVANNASVQFEGLTFGPPRKGGRYFGVYANGAAASVTASNCRFQNVYYGALVYSGRLIASNCDFNGNVYGAYGSKAASCALQNCRFSNATSIAAVLYTRDAVIQNCSFDKSRYGVYVRGVDSKSRMALNNLSVSNCTFGFYGRDSNVVLDGSAVRFRNCAYDVYLSRCVSDISGLAIVTGRRPLTLVRGTAAIRDIRIQESQSYGIYAVHMDRVSLTGSRFGKTPSWAAYLHGRDVSASDCQFDESKNGLLLRGVDAKSNIALNRLSFNKCRQGLYCQTASIKPSRDNAISTSNCTYGVVLNNCRSDLSGVKSRGDVRSVSVYGGEARISKVDVTNSKSYGIYTANMKQLAVNGCRFSRTGSWAVHAHGRQLSVTDSTFSRTKYGLYVRELSQTNAPVLRDLSFSGCSYGLRCDSSPVVMSPDNRLAFSNCVYGVTLIRCRSKLQGMDLSGSQRPLSLYRGTASIDGLVIRTSKTLGVYSSTMDQLSVTNSQFGTTGSWALYAHGKNLSVTSSKFTGSRYGLYVRETTGTNSPVLRDLAFNKCTGTGLQVASSTFNLPMGSNIRVDDCGYGIYLANCTSKLSGLTLASSNIPLYVRGGTCEADGVTIAKAGTYGLLAYKMLGFSGKNLKCSGARSWGFYGYGQNISLSDSTVSSCGHGIYLDGQGMKRSIPLSNVAVQDNSGYGLYVKNASFNVVPKSTLKILRNRGTGLYLRGQNIDLNADSGIEVTDNGIGIYANRTNVKMSGFKLKGNGYGILQYYGNLECRDSAISGGRYGIYQTNSPRCLLEDTTVSGTSSWGVVVRNSQAKNQQVTLKDSKITSCGGGISANMLNDSTLNVSGATIADHRSHGIYSWRAKSTLTKTTVARNRGYGVLHYDGAIDVSDSTIEDSGSYGLMVYGYRTPGASRIVARRNRLTRNSSGIFAYRVDDAEIVNNVVAGNRSYGVAVNVSGSGEADVWNNSIVDNRYGVWHLGGRGSIRNNIIANGDMKAKVASAYGIYRSSGTVDIGHNLLFGQQRKYVNAKPGLGDVIKPPRFVDHANGDYRLAAGSPAINAGTSPGKLTAVDIQGLSRPLFDAFEIGAFEYPKKSGSVRILDWGEMAAPPKSMILNGRSSFKSLLR
jgi:nitrous oxidase accessory protein NosD